MLCYIYNEILPADNQISYLSIYYIIGEAAKNGSERIVLPPYSAVALTSPWQLKFITIIIILKLIFFLRLTDLTHLDFN